MMKPASRSPAEGSDPKYKGVRKRKWGKWVSEIRLPNSRERIWLGSYDAPEKAARAFDAALFCLRGRTAKFNFPNSPPDIVGGRSLAPAEIQVAAARFANSYSDSSRASHQGRASPSGFGNSELPTSQSDHSSSSYEMQTESPSPSVSDGAAQVQGEIAADGSILDLSTMGPENNVSNYGIFPGFDDLSSDFFTAATLPTPDYGDEHFDYGGVYTQDPCLWNF